MSFLDNIKAIPVADLAERMGYTLVKKGRYYRLKEHDSVIIDTQKNCFWRNSRFSQGAKGGAGSSIDFVMEFGGETDYKNSMRRLALMYGIEGEKMPQMAYRKVEPLNPLKEEWKKILPGRCSCRKREKEMTRCFVTCWGAESHRALLNIFLPEICFMKIYGKTAYSFPLTETLPVCAALERSGFCETVTEAITTNVFSLREKQMRGS